MGVAAAAPDDASLAEQRRERHPSGEANPLSGHAERIEPLGFELRLLAGSLTGTLVFAFLTSPSLVRQLEVLHSDAPSLGLASLPFTGVPFCLFFGSATGALSLPLGLFAGYAGGACVGTRLRQDASVSLLPRGGLGACLGPAFLHVGRREGLGAPFRMIGVEAHPEPAMGAGGEEAHIG